MACMLVSVAAGAAFCCVGLVVIHQCSTLPVYILDAAAGYRASQTVSADAD